MSDPVPQILFATDFSGGSVPAAEMAAAYARRLGARLHVLHVTHAGWEGEMLEALRAYVQRFADLPVTASVEAGSADRIVAYADLNRVELIVLGTHGRTSVARLMLGSVTDDLLKTLDTDLLVVPWGAE